MKEDYNNENIEKTRYSVLQRFRYYFDWNSFNKRFRYYFDWKSFNIGFGFCKTTEISGWKYMLSFDILFFSCWIYIGKSNKK